MLACSEGPSTEARRTADGSDTTEAQADSAPTGDPSPSEVDADTSSDTGENADTGVSPPSDTWFDHGSDTDAGEFDTLSDIADTDISPNDTVDGSSDLSVSDISDVLTPVTCTPRPLALGLAAGANELMPGGNRLRSAISPDGLTWTRLADPILDQAATPTLARLPDGRPLLFMTAHKIDGLRDGTAVAIGALDGRSWTHCKVELVGFPPNVTGVDPDVVTLSDGSYRIFLTAQLGPGMPPPIGIHYADSNDGLRWVYGGIALTKSGGSLIDSMTFLHDGLWHMYTLTTTSIAMVHATSIDGKTFTIASEGEILIGTEPHVLSHAAYIGFAHRIFSFGPRGETIRAFDIGAGGTLTGDSRALLSLKDGDPGDKRFVRDPAVTVLADGSYLMVYATAL